MVHCASVEKTSLDGRNNVRELQSIVYTVKQTVWKKMMADQKDNFFYDSLDLFCINVSFSYLQAYLQWKMGPIPLTSDAS